MVSVKKRQGNVVDFDLSRIEAAVKRAMHETANGVSEEAAKDIAESVFDRVISVETMVDVDFIQNLVEGELRLRGLTEAYERYSLYRSHRDEIRAKERNFKLLDKEFMSHYKHLPDPMNQLGSFVYYRTYSRWLPEEERREHWWETARRSVEYNCSIVDGVSKEESQKLYDNMYNLKQFLSGRTLWVGGTALTEDYGVANFNCAFCVIDDFDKFKELFYLLMVGTGVGFRVLKTDVDKLPSIRTNVQLKSADYTPTPKNERLDCTCVNFKQEIATIDIGDSKEGWTQALDFYLKILYSHEYKHINTVVMNYDNVRPNGERLKRFGGTASGHASLSNMFNKISEVISSSKCGNSNVAKLRPIHCLDICNIIGENVVVGGVRRTSEIGIIAADDEECILAKSDLYIDDGSGKWKENKTISHRKMSNNSIFYTEKPSRERLHWQIEKMHYSGEPAFINAEAAFKRRSDFEGVNPCVETLLRDRGLCNLVTVVVSLFVKDGELDLDGLIEAQRLSARAGLRMTCINLELPKWDAVQKEDRLVGLSLTGWQDAIDMLGFDKEQEDALERLLKVVAHTEIEEYAIELGISKPKLVCTIKPEGTLSLLPSVSAGMHYSHSPYFIRRVRITASDPLVKVCNHLNYPVFPENGETWENCKTVVVEFPIKAHVSKTKYDVSAISQLENYKRFMKNYVDHNASITVSVKNHEWDEVEQWLWDNWDDVVAVSFLSLSDNFYPLAPYEAITEEEYTSRVSNMNTFRPSLITKYEPREVNLDLIGEGCSGGACPIK